MKVNASKKAIEYVENDTILALGSGTTTYEFIKLLAQRIKEGLSVKCVSTSYDTSLFARALDIKTIPFENVDHIDLAIDGADVATPIGLLKGGGGACTIEKLVDYYADRFIVVVDESKVKQNLNGIVTIEVIPMAFKAVMKNFEHAKLRMASRKLGPVITDGGNFLIDVDMNNIENPSEKESLINNIPGVIENGIFTKFDLIIVGKENTTEIINHE
jgi:ribose 5-phosphate isomerase A